MLRGGVGPVHGTAQCLQASIPLGISLAYEIVTIINQQVVHVYGVFCPCGAIIE
jgi:hypothetical protein